MTTTDVARPKTRCGQSGSRPEPAKATHCVAQVRRPERASAQAEGRHAVPSLSIGARPPRGGLYASALRGADAARSVTGLIGRVGGAVARNARRWDEGIRRRPYDSRRKRSELRLTGPDAAASIPKEFCQQPWGTTMHAIRLALAGAVAAAALPVAADEVNIYSSRHYDTDGTTRAEIRLDLSRSVTARGSVGSDGNSTIGLYYERDY